MVDWVFGPGEPGASAPVHWLQPVIDVLQWTILPLLIVLALLGGNLLALTLIRLAAPRRPPPRPAIMGPDVGQPTVVVQLPVYNEGALVERALRAAAELDWPRDRLRIQLLDDSTDGSLPANAAVARRIAGETGATIDVLHRTGRAGFKAGALAAGVAASDADFFVVLDADFMPSRDFLRRLMPPILADEDIGFVQARWVHANATQSPLTQAQARLLDAHFHVEQEGRWRAGLPFAFNGTCGVWRRAAIEAAGGWQGDTLSEDLDLSLRAQMAGWRGVFLEDLTVPGELPTTPYAWKVQQFRWTKGYVQVLLKLAPRIWRAPLPVTTRIAITLQVAQSLFFPVALTCLLAGLPVMAAEISLHPLMALASAGGLVGLTGAVVALAAGGLVSGLGVLRLARDVLYALTFTSGLMLSNSRAVLEALGGHASAFQRTPKAGARRVETVTRPPIGVAELIAGAALVMFIGYVRPWESPFLAVTATGLLLLPVLSLIRASTRRPRTGTGSHPVAGRPGRRPSKPLANPLRSLG